MNTDDFKPKLLDVRAFALSGGQLNAELPLSNLERLAHDLRAQSSDNTLKNMIWRATGESKTLPGSAAQTWLHLSVEAHLPMICQRCLQAMEQRIQIERSFRFVRDEKEAVSQDEESTEDLLVISKQFDLLELIEDEIIMALPFAPTHEACPSPVKLQTQDDGFDAALAAKPNAFAALGQFKIAR